MHNEGTTINDLREALKKSLSSDAIRKFAGIEENAPESNGDCTEVSSPAAGQSGIISDVISGKIGDGENTQPGETSNVVDNPAPNGEKQGVEASANVKNNEEDDPTKLLDIKEEPVTKEKLDMIDKHASALLAVANKWDAEALAQSFQKQASEKDLSQSFQKQASEKDLSQPSEKQASEEELGYGTLVKLASAGDVAAQNYLDFAYSFELGMAKKASDMEAALGDAADDPEAVAAAEQALNEGAIEDPSSVLGEDVSDADLEAGASEMAESAEIENAAQEAMILVAGELLDQNPEMGEEEALMIAQKAVVDALDTVAIQQASSEVGEDGEFVADDGAVEGAVEDLVKTASANPLRDRLVDHFNATLGLDPQLFYARIHA